MIVVRNGTVDSFETGIDLAATSRGEVRGISANYNTGNGVVLGTRGLVKSAGDNSMVSKNLSQSNANGITVGKLGTVSFNLAGNNAGFGIHAGSSSQVNGNSSAENAGVGIWLACPGTASKNESWDNSPNYSSLASCRASNNQ